MATKPKPESTKAAAKESPGGAINALDEVNKISRAFVFSVMEFAQAEVDLTRNLIDRLHGDSGAKTYKTESGEKTYTATRRILEFPSHAVRAVGDTLNKSNELPNRVIDAFYEKYKEG